MMPSRHPTTPLDIIFCLLTATIIITSLLAEYYRRKLGAPSAPTFKWVRRAIIDGIQEIGQDLPPGEIAELGSGWGSLAIDLARAYPDRAVRGYELSPVPYAVSKLRQLVSPRSLHFYRRDLFTADLSHTALMVCYLTPVVLQRLAEKLRREMPPGALIVCNTFPLPNWQPVAVRPAGHLLKSQIFFYRVPAL